MALSRRSNLILEYLYGNRTPELEIPHDIYDHLHDSMNDSDSAVEIREIKRSIASGQNYESDIENFIESLTVAIYDRMDSDEVAEIDDKECLELLRNGKERKGSLR